MSYQSRSLYILTFGEFWDRFSFFGMLTIMVLYLTKTFMLSDDKSYVLYGIYLTLSFALPVAGGLFADRIIGLRKALIIGAILLIAGNILLTIHNINTFYYGLAITICGTGLYKASCTSMIGLLYPNKDITRREAGFTFFYAGMNIGAVLGAIVYGLVAHELGWSTCFIFSAVGIFIGLITFLININPQPALLTTALKNTFIYIAIGLVCFFIGILFILPYIFNDFLLLFSIIILLMLITLLVKQKPSTRYSIFALLIITAFCMFFFAASLQVGSSITLFLQRDVNRILFGWQIPTIVFSSLNPLFVVIMAPVFILIWKFLARYNKEPSSLLKLFYGLTLASISFIVFMFSAISSANNGHYLPLLLIVFAYLLLGAGEICLSPAILSTISRFSPRNLQGTMMGIWYLSLAFGGYFSGILARISDQSVTQISKVFSIHIYSHTFIIIALITFSMAILLLILSPLIKAMLKHYQN